MIVIFMIDLMTEMSVHGVYGGFDVMFLSAVITTMSVVSLMTGMSVGCGVFQGLGDRDVHDGLDDLDMHDVQDGVMTAICFMLSLMTPGGS
jgi:hypothetical protein